MVSALLWTARIAALAAVLPLMLIAFGEHGAGPAGAREWAYLLLFPFGFAMGYLAGWRWPLVGGAVSLACLGLSLLVIGRVFPARAYLTWGVLALPGLLYVVVGLRARRAARGGRAPVRG